MKILQGFSVGEAVAEHAGVFCYPAIRDGSDDKYIVKNISVPASGVQLSAMLLTGAYQSREEALAYYKGIAQEILQEARIVNELSQMEGFLPFTATELRPKADGSGYQVALLSPFQLSLEQIFAEQVMTHQGIMDLAMDLCAALAACRRAGYLYIDLKPGNVFYTENQDYRIGDLGFIGLNYLQYACLPEKYHSIYTAPEIEDAASQLNTTMDVYALGLILYQAYNGGTLPLSDGKLPSPLLPPIYADYEMAEIILTACHNEPDKRFADPTALGQALVQYMQRNGVSEEAIIPPPVSTPELDAGEDFLPEEDLPESQDWSSIPELAFMEELVDDETAPSLENTEGLEEGVTEETSDMLAQADDLIAHVLPDPVIAPEPIEVPMPAPIVLEPEPEPVPEEVIPEEIPEEVPETAEQPPAEEEPAESAEEPAQEETETETCVPPAEVEEAPQQQEQEEPPAAIPPRKLRRIAALVGSIIALLALVGLAIWGWFYYQSHYVHTIDGLQITGTVDSITVQVQTTADPSLVTVTCSDTYGNSFTAALENGIATFTGLNPQTRYTIRISVPAKHKLTGHITDSFITGQQTSIDRFTAGIGPEDGSVYLNFTVTGNEPKHWTVHWEAEGEEAGSMDFEGHSVTVTGLTIGKEYTFTLCADDSISLAGNLQVDFLACPITLAQNVTIDSWGDGQLTLSWEAPADTAVYSWTVRCFNSAGFEETVTTSELSCTFTGMPQDTDCTVEITAHGMTQSVTVTATADPVWITEAVMGNPTNGYLPISWEFSNPSGNVIERWGITWTIDGYTDYTEITDSTVIHLPYIPGCVYEITIVPVTEHMVFGTQWTFTAPESTEFALYGITASDMQFMMCAPGEEESWQWEDLPQDAYTTSFASYQKMGFVVWCDKEMELPEDEIYVRLILRKEDGTLVQWNSLQTYWGSLWENGFWELTLPIQGYELGNYQLEILIQDQIVHIQDFTIQ